MDLTGQRDLIPHYVAVVVLVGAAVVGLRNLSDSVPIWLDLLAVVVVVLGYPSLARWLDIAPDAWTE